MVGRKECLPCPYERRYHTRGAEKGMSPTGEGYTAQGDTRLDVRKNFRLHFCLRFVFVCALINETLAIITIPQHVNANKINECDLCFDAHITGKGPDKRTFAIDKKLTYRILW